MELKTQILKALGLSTEEVSLEYQTKLEDGTIIVSSADSLEAGVDVSVLTEDGTTIPLPEGEYKTEDGVGFSVEQEGVVAEIYETEEEETTEEEEAKKEEDMEEELEMDEVIEEVEEPSEVEEARHPKKIKTTEEIEFNKEELIKEVANIVSELLGDMKTEVTELSSQIEDLRGYKETLEEELVELSAEPAGTPITTNKFSTDQKPLSRKDYNKLNGKERFLYNLNNN